MFDLADAGESKKAQTISSARDVVSERLGLAVFRLPGAAAASSSVPVSEKIRLTVLEPAETGCRSQTATDRRDLHSAVFPDF